MTFLEYFSESVRHIYLVERSESRLMRLCNLGLRITNRLGWSSIKNFMTAYCTTIARTIYAHPRWPRDMQPRPLMVHELTHVLQWSLLYALRYLLSKRWRLRYESEAIQTEMLCFDYCRTTDYIRARAEDLVDYGLGKEEASSHLVLLLLHAQKRDELEPNARKVWEAYRAWNRTG